MEGTKLHDILTELLTSDKSSIDILQNLSKGELEEVQEALYVFGYHALDALEKSIRYQIPGVESAGFIPEGHPDRQKVVEHINKLMTLPDSHPKKGIARNVAMLLQERHLTPPKDVGASPGVIDDRPKPKAAPEPKAAGPQTENVLDYSKFNKKPQRAEPAQMLDYSSGTPEWKPNPAAKPKA